MTQRFDFPATAPEAFAHALALELFVAREASIDRRLLHLLKIRASQINGCSYCLDMHAKAARRDGLDGQWLDLIAAWRGARVYDERETAVLGWTNAVTRIAETGAGDDDYLRLHRQFSEAEIAALTLAIGTINLWNRLIVSFRSAHPVDGLGGAESL